MTLAGHGCPKWCNWITAAVMVCACASWSAATVAEELSIELRAVWGGGPTRTFAGNVQISDGTLELVRNLSVQDDSAAAVIPVSRKELALRPHSPSSFGGADLRVKGRLDSQLQFEFKDPSNSTPQQVKVTLKQLLSGRELFSIDTQGSKLALERPLHDRVRMNLGDGRAIWRAGDTTSLIVEGRFTGLTAGDYRLNLRLHELASERTVQQLHQDINIDDQGNFSPATFSALSLPSVPGVYAFDVSIVRRRLINNLMSNSTLPNRRLEFVIAPTTSIASSNEANHETRWQSVAQVYPAGVSWWDSLGKFRIPTIKSITPLVTQTARPLSSGDHQRQMIGDKECMVLAGGAWQAFPISVSDVGKPHRVIVQVPADMPQKLVFSIQEPSAASDAPALRLDTGMMVEMGSMTSSGMTSHQMLFWPKQPHSYFLVTNADAQRSAVLAEINLEVAAEGLQSTLQSSSVGATERASTRISSIYLDKPLLAENFCAQRRVEGPRELDSWQTAWQASERLAEYTAWSGNNAATVTVATQGGAIYPSRILNPTHKFDSGTFLSDGASPEIKDWVGLMCEHFDQRGLKLILAIDIEGPLVELERRDDEAPTDSPAVMARYQTDLAGKSAKAFGESTSESEPVKHTIYNPLDARVQAVLTRIVRELAERYGRHPALAGIQINLSERSHFNFAGDAWGYDEESLVRLQREVGTTLPKDRIERDRLLRGPLRLSFLNQRAQLLSVFYDKLAKEVATHAHGAKLIINPTKLVAMPPASENYLLAASQALSPAEILLASGVDCRALAKVENCCVLRPDADSPLRTPASRAWSYRLSGDSQLDVLFAEHAPYGAMVQQLPTSIRLTDFDKVNPYGHGRSRTWLFPHAMLAGDSARRNLSQRLFHSDLQHLSSGGWMVPIGQEEVVRPWLTTLQQFPPVSMRDLSPTGISPTLKVRRTEFDGQTWLQIVNNSSWTETISLELQCAQDAAMTVLKGHAASESERDESSEQLLRAHQLQRVSLVAPAYGLIGVCIHTEQVELKSIQSSPPTDLAERIDKRLSELQTLIDRAGELNEQQTLGLRGGDFETWEANGMPLGWTVSNHPSTSVTEEHELPRTGSTCVRLVNRSENNATAWLQSDRIAIPATGRLALEVWVRTLPGPTQPTVRLSLMGRYRDGKRFQRWHEFASANTGTAKSVGTVSPSAQSRLSIDWGNRPLVLLVPDVPNEELAELRAAIDLVGQGTIWVDDVRVYGMYLHPEEKVHLSGQMFMAREQMRQGNFALADQMLNSFWSNFLTTYLPSPGAAAAADSGRMNEARLPLRTNGFSTPSNPPWRKPNAPRASQWQESWRGRWQR